MHSKGRPDVAGAPSLAAVHALGHLKPTTAESGPWAGPLCWPRVRSSKYAPASSAAAQPGHPRPAVNPNSVSNHTAAIRLGSVRPVWVDLIPGTSASELEGPHSQREKC